MVDCGDEIQNELARKLVQKYDKFLCKDSAFAECLGLEQNSCEKHIPVVLNLTFRASGLELFLILSASFFQREVQKSLSDISRYSSMVL